MKSLYMEVNYGQLLATKILGAFSRRAYVGRIAPLRYGQVPRPRLLGDNWVRVRNLLCGICGSDVHYVFLETDLRVAIAVLDIFGASASGQEEGGREAAEGGRQRIYMGHEVVSQIIEVGPAVKHFRVGERVTVRGDAGCWGKGFDPPCECCAVGDYQHCRRAAEPGGPHGEGAGWSEEMTLPETNLARVPDNLSDEEAVLLEPASNGVHMALRANPQPGDKVLVIGGGTIGLLTMQAVRIIQPKCDITVSVLFPYQAEEALRLGANRAWVRRDLYQATAELTGATLYSGLFGERALRGGFDLIYDCVGSDQTLETALRITRHAGMVVLGGVKAARMRLDLSPIYRQEVDLRGFYAKSTEVWEGKRISSLDLAMRWAAEGQMRLAGLLTHTFPPSRYREALLLAGARDRDKYRVTKVAFDWRSRASAKPLSGRCESP